MLFNFIFANKDDHSRNFSFFNGLSRKMERCTCIRFDFYDK
ncbi:MAG: hypothetical protein IE881_08270 [Epsilonproteobacteria bacterium]|nr:hypothetical protein [Campylobacterota bacterium]